MVKGTFRVMRAPYEPPIRVAFTTTLRIAKSLSSGQKREERRRGMKKRQRRTEKGRSD
jgi:hypothetical protein